MRKRSRLPVLMPIAAAVLLCASFLGTLYYLEEQGQAESAAAQEQRSQETKASIAAIKAENAAKAKAALAKKKAAAARKAAEAAKHMATGSAPTAEESKACNDGLTHVNSAALDVIVNKKHCIQPLDYAPPLVTVYGATLYTVAKADFMALYEAAQADNLPFSVTSSYRSYDTQIGTYNYWVSVNGADGADTISARPGYSEHQTGLSIDVAAPGCSLDCFVTTPQYQWFKKHAADYGWIQRYPKGYEAITGYATEEWHYRYVGKSVAGDMKTKGITTLEEYWGVNGGDYAK